jgi:anti-anti-sigma factor
MSPGTRPAARVLACSDSSAVIALSGEIDITTASRLHAFLRRYVREGHVDITLELGQLRFIDSRGLSVLVAVQKQVNDQDGRLALHNPTPAVKNVLDLTGLSQVIEVLDPDPDGEG